MIAAASLSVQCRTAGRKEAEKDRARQTSTPSPQEKQTSAFTERMLTNARGEKMRYLLHVPASYDRREKYPLILWLHGGGSRGDDLKLLLTYGDQHGIGYLARRDVQSSFPSFIVAPQCPRNKLWADPDADQPSHEMKLVLEILDKVRADDSIDARRLYVMGISMGGYGTWDIVARRPGLFAAAVPICGGGSPSQAAATVKTAVWAFHGERDELVNPSESRRMITALRLAGGEPRYTEYKGVGHNSWERTFSERDLLPWLFTQQR